MQVCRSPYLSYRRLEREKEKEKEKEEKKREGRGQPPAVAYIPTFEILNTCHLFRYVM
jgi:hypothetical protein